MTTTFPQLSETHPASTASPNTAGTPDARRVSPGIVEPSLAAEMYKIGGYVLPRLEKIRAHLQQCGMDRWLLPTNAMAEFVVRCEKGNDFTQYSNLRIGFDRSDTLSPIRRLSPPGFTVRGEVRYLVVDFDVGHGEKNAHDSIEAANADAQKVRAFVNGAAEIRRSTGGRGVHIRVPVADIPSCNAADAVSTCSARARSNKKSEHAAERAKWCKPDTNCGYCRSAAAKERAACITARLLLQAGVKTYDPAAVRCQHICLFATDAGENGFELIEPAVGEWRPNSDFWAKPPEDTTPKPTQFSISGEDRCALFPVEQRIKLAGDWIVKQPAAVAGENGHSRTFATTSKLIHGFGLTIEQARPLLFRWNQTCVPPWNDSELEHKLTDAEKTHNKRGRGYLLPCKADPATLAKMFLEQQDRRVIFFDGSYYRFTGVHYEKFNLADRELVLWLGEINPDGGSNGRRSVLMHVQALCTPPANLRPGCWLETLNSAPVHRPELVAFQNGILNIDKALAQQPDAFGDHDERYFCTGTKSYKYDPEATAPTFTAFLNRCFPDTAVQDLLCDWMGYCLTPDHSRQQFLALSGQSGANGKSTYLTILQALLGTENTSAVSVADLVDRTLVITMRDKLLNIIDEVHRFSKAEEARLKHLVTGVPLTLRGLHKDAETMSVNARLIVATNEPLHFNSVGNSTWRRAIIVPCDVSIPPAQRNPRFTSIEFWQTECPGIFNAALAGFSRVRLRGFTEPDCCAALKVEERASSDPVRSFFTDHYSVQSHFTFTRELLKDFQDWAKAEGYTKLAETLNTNALSRHLKAVFPGAAKTRNAWGIAKIIQPPAPAPVPAPPMVPAIPAATQVQPSPPPVAIQAAPLVQQNSTGAAPAIVKQPTTTQNVTAVPGDTDLAKDAEQVATHPKACKKKTRAKKKAS